MPRFKTAYAWRDGNRYCVSTLPRGQGGAVSVYDNPTAVLQAAVSRSMILKWEDPGEVDQSQ